MSKVTWAKRALEDIERLQAFLIRNYPPAAPAAFARIRGAADHLNHHPQMGKAVDDRPGLRQLEISFGSSAYILRYRLGPQGQPIILRVFHSRENRQFN